MFAFILSRSIRALLALMFQPPFEGLWAAVLLYYFWCFLVHPQGQILRGNLPDPDDYMYLDQVLDWMKGQGWYDHLQHRLDPPEGGLIHFSRLAMIPMALLTLFFELLGLRPTGAATLMAIFYPLILFAGSALLLAPWRCAGAGFVMPEKLGGRDSLYRPLLRRPSGHVRARPCRSSRADRYIDGAGARLRRAHDTGAGEYRLGPRRRF